MENQSNFQAKVDSFNTYLKMVSEQIAEGVGPATLNTVAPTISKHCNVTEWHSVMRNNIKGELHKSIDNFTEKFKFAEKTQELIEISNKDSTETETQSLAVDPSLIRKYLLDQLIKKSEGELKRSRQKTLELCSLITKKRSTMKQHLMAMEKIENTHFGEI